MRVSYNDLIDGKAIKIKNEKYLDTKYYIKPFIDIVSKDTDDIRYTAKEPEYVTSVDVNMYPRVLIEAIYPYPSYKNRYKKTVCMSYGLDVAVPLWKVYMGFTDIENGTFFVTDPDNIIMDRIVPENGFDYGVICNFMDNDSNPEYLEDLDNIEIPYDEKSIVEMLGKWIMRIRQAQIFNDFGKIKLPTECVSKAYKLLYEDMNSPYYIPVNTTTSALNIYGAWTRTIADNHRDLLNRFEKTSLLEKILKMG